MEANSNSACLTDPIGEEDEQEEISREGEGRGRKSKKGEE